MATETTPNSNDFLGSFMCLFFVGIILLIWLNKLRKKCTLDCDPQTADCGPRTLAPRLRFRLQCSTPTTSTP